MQSLCRAARGISLWEFLKLKVRHESDRPNSIPQLAQMIGEFDALQQQLQTVVKDHLVPVSTETSHVDPASKILVVSSAVFLTARLAGAICLIAYYAFSCSVIGFYLDSLMLCAKVGPPRFPRIQFS